MVGKVEAKKAADAAQGLFGDEVSKRFTHAIETIKIVVVRVYSAAMASGFYVANTVTGYQFASLGEQSTTYWHDASNFGGNLRAHTWGVMSPSWAEEIEKEPAKKPAVKKVEAKKDEPKIEENVEKQEEKIEKLEEKIKEQEKEIAKAKSDAPAKPGIIAKAGGAAKSSVDWAWGKAMDVLDIKSQLVARGKEKAKFLKSVEKAKTEISVEFRTFANSGSFGAVDQAELNKFVSAVNRKWSDFKQQAEENFNRAVEEKPINTWSEAFKQELIDENKAAFCATLSDDINTLLYVIHDAKRVQAFNSLWPVIWEKKTKRAVEVAKAEVEVAKNELIAHLQANPRPVIPHGQQTPDQKLAAKEAALVTAQTRLAWKPAPATMDEIETRWVNKGPHVDFSLVDGDHKAKMKEMELNGAQWNNAIADVMKGQPLQHFATLVNDVNTTIDALLSPANPVIAGDLAQWNAPANAGALQAVVNAAGPRNMGARGKGAVAGGIFAAIRHNAIVSGAETLVSALIGFSPWEYAKGYVSDIWTLAGEGRTWSIRTVLGLTRATIGAAVMLQIWHGFCQSASYLFEPAAYGSNLVLGVYLGFTAQSIVIGSWMRGNRLVSLGVTALYLLNLRTQATDLAMEYLPAIGWKVALTTWSATSAISNVGLWVIGNSASAVQWSVMDAPGWLQLTALGGVAGLVSVRVGYAAYKRIKAPDFANKLPTVIRVPYKSVRWLVTGKWK